MEEFNVFDTDHTLIDSRKSYGSDREFPIPEESDEFCYFNFPIYRSLEVNPRPHGVEFNSNEHELEYEHVQEMTKASLFPSHCKLLRSSGSNCELDKMVLKRDNTGLPPYDCNITTVSTILIVPFPKQTTEQFVTKFLNENHIKFVADFKNARWQCEFSARVALVRFQIQLYSVSSTASIVIELMKLDGCCFLFCEVFKALKDSTLSTISLIVERETFKRFTVEPPQLNETEKECAMKTLFQWLDEDPYEASVAVTRIAMKQSDSQCRDSLLAYIGDSLIRHSKEHHVIEQCVLFANTLMKASEEFGVDIGSEVKMTLLNKLSPIIAKATFDSTPYIRDAADSIMNFITVSVH